MFGEVKNVKIYNGRISAMNWK